MFSFSISIIFSYEYFVSECKKIIPVVETGIFGADMKVEIYNDGPVTIILDSILLNTCPFLDELLLTLYQVFQFPLELI